MLTLAQTTTVPLPIISPALDGITIVLAAYWFYSLANPAQVRKPSQFWLVFYVLIFLVVCYTLRVIFYPSAAAQVILAVFIGLAHIAGLVLTVMYAAGLTGRDVADNLGDAAHAFNNAGEARKPKIVPITGQMPKRREDVRPADPDEPRPRIVIDLPKKPPEDKGSLPLE